ncbi:helix-turn-helix domain-containing protein [Nocardia panacis]|nr:helix-turn-helix transcriptional regulator [Nocardia panacis]
MEQWEFGRLVQEARERARLSKREAAKRAGISEARWRQLELGYETVRGQTLPVRTTPETVSGIAETTGADRRQLLAAAGFDPAVADVPVGLMPQTIYVGGLAADDIEKVRSYVAFLKSQAAQAD